MTLGRGQCWACDMLLTPLLAPLSCHTGYWARATSDVLAAVCIPRCKDTGYFDGPGSRPATNVLFASEGSTAGYRLQGRGPPQRPTGCWPLAWPPSSVCARAGPSTHDGTVYTCLTVIHAMTQHVSWSAVSVQRSPCHAGGCVLVFSNTNNFKRIIRILQRILVARHV